MFPLARGAGNAFVYVGKVSINVAGVEEMNMCD
jgi:hypothetical protein